MLIENAPENAPEDEKNVVKLPMAAEIPFAERNGTRAVRKNDWALRLARIDRQSNTSHGVSSTLWQEKLRPLVRAEAGNEAPTTNHSYKTQIQALGRQCGIMSQDS